MKPATWISGFSTVLLALANGCGGNSQSDPSTSEDSSGGDAGSSNTGGVSAARATSGGGGAGADATGGSDSGGAPTGGSSPGGTPTEAFLELDHSRMDFGTIVLGTTATDTFTLTNRGASTSGIPTISVQSSGLSSAVTISGCDAALAPGESCTLTLGVSPPDLGLFDTFVRIVADPGTDPHLSIFVVGHAGAFEISPPAVLELGNVEPGDPRQHSITVTATAPISDLEVLTGWDEVSVVASATTCTDTLAAGDSCVVTVQFLSLDVGWFHVGVGIRAGGDLGQMEGVGITANVTSAEDLAVEPANPPPFEAYFDETTDPIVLTVTNVGAATSGTITSTIVGESASDFAISDTDCTTLAPQGTCTVSVVCSPPMSAVGGPREAVVSITDGNTHVPIPLTAEVSFRE